MDKYDQKAARRRNTIEFLKMDMAAAVYHHNKTIARSDSLELTPARVIVKRRKTIGVWKGGV